MTTESETWTCRYCGGVRVHEVECDHYYLGNENAVLWEQRVERSPEEPASLWEGKTDPELEIEVREVPVIRTNPEVDRMVDEMFAERSPEPAHITEVKEAVAEAIEESDREIAALNRAASPDLTYPHTLARLNAEAGDFLTRSLAKENAMLFSRIAELERERDEAWGLEYCCDGSDCGCMGKPINPPPYWEDAQKARELESENARLREVVEAARWVVETWLRTKPGDPLHSVTRSLAVIRKALSALNESGGEG